MSRARVEARRLTATERLRASIGLSPAEYRRLGLEEDAWKRWDAECGPEFRALHGIETAVDLGRLRVEPATLFLRAAP